MHPPLTIHMHSMCAELVELSPIYVRKNGVGLCQLELTCLYSIEEFQKCHTDHPLGKCFGQCTDLKIKLDKCFRQEKAMKRKANFEGSKKLNERLRAYRKETAEAGGEKNVAQA